MSSMLLAEMTEQRKGLAEKVHCQNNDGQDVRGT